MVQRERKLDVSKMSKEEVEGLSVQIGDKVREICDEASEKVNTILKIYGMSAKMAIQFDTLPGNTKKIAKPANSRVKKPKQDNLK